ncbi:uncharacterized protein TNCV_4379261 [Trichonephila clavipes]|nr:uncharacterized protein TNCV_4379261 [Trichonephila clavipes]
MSSPGIEPSLYGTAVSVANHYTGLDRFNVHRCPTRRVFRGTGLELVIRQATIRYIYHSATTATSEKAGKVSRTTNDLNVCRLPTQPKTLKGFSGGTHRVCQHMLNEGQIADEVESASQAKLNDMAQNRFQKCFDDLHKPWQKCVAAQESYFGGGCISVVKMVETGGVAICRVEVQLSQALEKSGTGENFLSVPCLNCGDRWWLHLSSLQGISPSYFVLSPVWCSRPTTVVLLAPCHDEFRGSRSDSVRQVA